MLILASVFEDDDEDEHEKDFAPCLTPPSSLMPRPSSARSRASRTRLPSAMSAAPRLRWSTFRSAATIWRRGFADEIRPDGQLAMAAVNQHRELDFFRAAKIVQRVHCRARGAAAEQHVVHQHDGLAGHVERDDGRVNRGSGALVQIVTMHVHVENTHRHGVVPDAGESLCESGREVVAANGNAYQHHVVAIFVALGNFMRNAREGALDRRGVEDDGGFRHKKSQTYPALGRRRFASRVPFSFFLRGLAGLR